MSVTLIIVVIIALVVIALIAIYNGLIKARLKVDNAWSQIDVQLQRRFDLIPNFIETVKGTFKYIKNNYGCFWKLSRFKS